MVRQEIELAREHTEQLRDRLERGPGARELSTAITKLEEAEMWVDRAQQRSDGAAEAART